MNIEISSEAASKISTILSTLEEPVLGLRLGVQGGGCAGFQYIIAPCFESDDLDFIIEKDGLMIYIDGISAQYLEGSIIGYDENNLGQNITITNPSHVGACGCGQSFYKE